MTSVSKFEIVTAKTRFPVLRVHTDVWRFVHSPYDPYKEAESLVRSWKIDVKTIAIYGLGVGYHVQAVLSEYPALEGVYVIEPYAQIVALAKEWSGILNDPRVTVLEAANEVELNGCFAGVANMPLFLHPPSVEICPYPGVASLLKEMQLLTQTVRIGASLLHMNWRQNMPRFSHDTVYSGKEDFYAGRPGVLIAAGPSLESHLEWLRNDGTKHMVTLSVSAVLAKLLSHGIQPTAAIMSDGGEIVKTHISDLKESVELPPLFLLSTSHPDVPTDYIGQIHWLLQRGFDPAEALAHELDCDLFETGGSVATLALSLLYYWGCDPIIFVGQDLAYVDGKAYTNDTHHDFLYGNPSGQGQIVVNSVYGTPINTTPTWNTFRHWIERFITRHGDRTYINLSHGADIKGTIHRLGSEF
jgi:hypothetical protein